MISVLLIALVISGTFTFCRSSAAESTLDVKKICQYGGFCRSDSDCVLGNKCMIQSEYYSQCIPDTSSYSNVSTGCIAQYGRCSSTTKCCDPGAICTSYNQCVQPHTPPDCVYPGGYSAGEAGETFAEVPLQVGESSIQNLPDALLQAPPVFKGGAKKPGTQFGDGAPASVVSDNLPEDGNQAKASRFSSTAYSGSLFANFKASDSGTVNAGSYSMPPDNTMCAGNDQVVLVVNVAMRAYSTTGAILKTVSLNTLFGNTLGSFFDPVCRYDTENSRWIIVSAYLRKDTAGNIINSGMYVLTTQTADITGNYWHYYYELKNYCASGQCFADFPTVGQDKYGVWLSINKFANLGAYQGTILLGLRKESMYSQASTSACVWDNVRYSNNNIFTIQPVSDLGTSGVDGTEYFIANYGANSVWKGTMTGTSNLGVTCANVLFTQALVTGLQTMSRPPSSMIQKNGLAVAGDDGRMNQATLSASKLYFTRAVATGTGTTVGVAYFAIDRTTNAILKQGIIGFDGWSVWNAAMVVNAAGYGVIVSTVLPPTTTSTITSMHTEFTLAGGHLGSTYYSNTNNLCGFTNPLRTGDYSGAAINTDGVAYVVSMTASSDVCPTRPTNWQAAIIKVVLTSTSTLSPSTLSTSWPTVRPTTRPTTAWPTVRPTARPTVLPTTRPTARPTVRPTARPTARPTTRPTARPTVRPTARPTARPTVRPTTRPTARPTVKNVSPV